MRSSFPSANKRLRQASQHREVGVKLHLRQPAHAERCESVAVLQIAERALNRNTSPVERAETIRVSRDAREQATAESVRQGWLIGLRTPEGDYRLAPSFLALGVDPVVVVFEVEPQPAYFRSC